MKRFISVLLAIILLVSTFTITAFAKDSAEIVKQTLRSERVFDVFAQIADVVHDGDGSEIFQTVLKTYPDLIAEIKKASNGDSDNYESDYVANDKETITVVRHMIKSQLIFDDLAKLADAVSTNDAAKMFMCILEIYPDFVAEAKKGWAEVEDSSSVASIFTESKNYVGYTILSGIGGLLIGAGVTFAIMKKKKEKAEQA